MTTRDSSVPGPRTAGWLALLAAATLLLGCSTSDGASQSAAPSSNPSVAAGGTTPPAVPGSTDTSGVTTGPEGGTISNPDASAPAPEPTAGSTPVPVPAGPQPTTGEATTVIEQLPPAASGLPEILPTNSQEEPIALDETALLACANNQIAWVDLQRGDQQSAASYLAVASARAAASAVQEVASQAPALESAARSSDRAVVDAFLALCTDRGFEY